MNNTNDFKWLLEQASDKTQPELLTREVKLLFMLLKAAETKGVTFPLDINSCLYALPGVLHDESVRSKTGKFYLEQQTAQEAMEAFSDEAIDFMLEDLSSEVTFSTVLDGCECETCGWNYETFEVTLKKDRTCFGTLRTGCYNVDNFSGVAEDVISDVISLYGKLRDVPYQIEHLFSELRDSEYAWAVPDLTKIADKFDANGLWIEEGEI